MAGSTWWGKICLLHGSQEPKVDQEWARLLVIFQGPSLTDLTFSYKTSSPKGSITSQMFHRPEAKPSTQGSLGDTSGHITVVGEGWGWRQRVCAFLLFPNATWGNPKPQQQIEFAKCRQLWQLSFCLSSKRPLTSKKSIVVLEHYNVPCLVPGKKKLKFSRNSCFLPWIWHKWNISVFILYWQQRW